MREITDMLTFQLRSHSVNSPLTLGRCASVVLLITASLGLCLIPPASAQAPLKIEEQPTHKLKVDPKWLTLSTISYTIATLDMARTIHTRNVLGNQFVEYNPLAAQMVKLPVPAYIGIGMGMVTLNNYLALRMRRSHTWLHRVWWIPQTFQIGGNLSGYLTTSTKMR